MNSTDDQGSHAELEVVHHVDSVLTTTLSVLLFMIGTTVGQRVEESIDHKLAVGLLVVSVIFWLAGILRQKWGMRLCAWWSTMFLVLTELSDLILYALGIRGLSAAGKALSWGSSD